MCDLTLIREAVYPNIYLTNLRSIKNKFDEFQAHISVINPAVIVCTETWLDSSAPTHAFDLFGYDLFRADRIKNSARDGEAIWARKRFRATPVIMPSLCQAEVCTIQISSMQLLISGLYLPPGMASYDFQAFQDTFAESLESSLKLVSHKLNVAGDFNQYNDNFLIIEMSLRNIVHGPTRLNACLDRIYVDRRIFNKYDHNDVVIGPPIGNSDHNTVLAVSNEQLWHRVSKKHILHDFRDSNIYKFEQKFLSNDFTSFYSCVDIDSKCEFFGKCVKEALEVIPKKTVFISNTDAPRMTLLIKDLINRRWDAYRSRKWTVFEALKVKVRKEIFKAKKRFFDKRSESVKGLWSFVDTERGASKPDSSFDPKFKRIHNKSP